MIRSISHNHWESQIKEYIRIIGYYFEQNRMLFNIEYAGLIVLTFRNKNWVK